MQMHDAEDKVKMQNVENCLMSMSRWLVAGLTVSNRDLGLEIAAG